MMSTRSISLHNLPVQATPFIGREPEISEIVTLLREEACRLLTLLGAGGMGKTRLSIEASKQLTQDDFEHGVYYVPLASLASADNIVTTVIGVLGIMIGNEGTPQQELVKFLSGRNLLLVMDNFEHVLDGADLVADILGNAQDVKILITSREPLNLLEEQLWHVRGMRIPDGAKVDDIDLYSGLKLFIDRAQRVRRDFDVDANMAEVIEICRMVGGMPLAIELSASWLKSLTCSDIIKEIQRNIDFLQTNVRNVSERHRSVRAVFDHSWSLLTKQEQAVLPRLSVFRGGFTREAAEAVAGADLMTLSGLVEKSMVRRDETGRYDMHELLRQYADEKLQLAGEFEQTLSTYMAYFAEFMAERSIDIKGRRQYEGLNEIANDVDNVIDVWYHALETRNDDALLDMMEGIALYCDMHAHYNLGNNLYADAYHALDQHGDIKNKPVWRSLLMRRAQVWILQDLPFESYYKQAEKALTLARHFGDKLLEAHCLWTIGEFERITNQQTGNTDNLNKAIALYEEGLAIYEALGETYYIGRIYRGMIWCWTYSWQEDPNDTHQSRRLELTQQYRNLTESIGDETGIAHAIYYTLGDYWRAGKFGQHIQKVIEAETIWRRMGDRKSVAIMVNERAWRARNRGDVAEAQSLLTEAKTMIDSINFMILHRELIKLQIVLYIYDEDYECAQQEIDKLRSLDNKSRYSLGWEFSFLSLIALGKRDIQTAKGILYEFFQFSKEQKEQAEYVEAKLHRLRDFSQVLAFEQNYEQAIEILSFALFNLADLENITGLHENWKTIIRLRADLKAQLGEEAYHAAWERGKQRDLDATVDEAIAYLSDGEESEPAKPLSQPLLDPLTDRELEVLSLMAEGLTNPQIAEKLYLSTGTIKVHTRNIYGKLNVSNRTEAAITGRELGLI